MPLHAFDPAPSRRCCPVVWSMMVTAVATVAGALSACGGPSDPARPNGAGPQEPAVLTHVHGLGVHPRDGQLYAASHYGVFRVDDGAATQVADRWQDTMAFTVTSDGTFLGSGHPDLREDLPPHLGLIESTDTAQTWSSTSLAGEADFHALEVAGPHVFGYDALTGRLLVTTDRVSWTTVATTEVVDLAWLGREYSTVLATPPRGGLVAYHRSGRSEAYASAPPVVLIDSPTPGELVGVTSAGQVFFSSDPSAEWSAAPARVPGTPEAVEATPDGWYVASDLGIYRSTDRGRSWDQVYDSPEHSYQ